MPRVQRWYKGFSYTGNSRTLVEQISEQVQRYNLSNFVPLVRVERGARRRTFYFFLAIESPQTSEIPTEVQSSLLRLPFFQYPIKGNPSFTYEQIKSMVGAAHHVHDYTNPIPYQPVQEQTYDNPFDFDLIASLPINQVSPDIEALSHRYEQLLYWLSALGSGTWESFKKACEALSLEEPKRILRRFKLLGHIESSPDGLRWSAAPTALVKVESQFPEFILCGQRCLNLLRQLEQYVVLTSSHQSRGDAPPCIRLQLTSPNVITNQFSIIDAGEASRRLAEILPNLATWQQSLRTLQVSVTSRYEWKRFDGNDFVECIFCNQTGMYQMWAREESDRPHLTLFYDSKTDTWQQGDWYGLRFLALHYSDQQCIARYDPATARLAIPFSQRWPELYERALVLASGRLPSYQRTEQSLWLIYENVGLELAHQLTTKLYVTCEEDSTCA